MKNNKKSIPFRGLERNGSIIGMLFVAFLSFTVTANAQKTVCDCVKLTVALLKDAKSLDFDAEKMKGLEDKYKDKLEKCKDLDKGKSEEDREKMIAKMKKCKQYEEMEKLSKEMMEAMLGNLDVDDIPEPINSEETALICDCVNIAVEMMEEAKALDFDREKMKGLEDKYKPEMEKCEQLDKGKSDEEKKEMERILKECESYDEIEKLSKEMMEAMMKGLNEEVPEEEMTICDCVNTTVEMMEEAKALDFDKEKMPELEGKYKEKMDRCDKLGEGKSDEEKIEMEVEMEACDAYEKVEKLSKEMMEAMKKD